MDVYIIASKTSLFVGIPDATQDWKVSCYPNTVKGMEMSGGLGESDYRQGYENPLQFQLDKRELQ